MQHFEVCIYNSNTFVTRNVLFLSICPWEIISCGIFRWNGINTAIIWFGLYANGMVLTPRLCDLVCMQNILGQT